MLNETDLARVDLNLLTLFDVVLAERHVGRAAQKLHLSPSAISHGLGRLRRLLNDPLFLKTPKGVVPTARANELAAPIAEVLARARSIVATAAPFDPASSTRRFTLGAPDGVSAVFLPTLLQALHGRAPGIAVSLRQLLPVSGETSPSRAWRNAFADLEARAMEVAILPVEDIPPRFEKRCLYEEDFVIAMRAGHDFARDASLKRYCEMRHLVVSESGDPHGFVDEHLARHGRSRRIALTVPNFMFALALIAESDLISALPRKLVARYAQRFNLASVNAPVPLPTFRLNAVAPKVAMRDAGVSWLIELLAQPQTVAPGARKRARRGKPAR